MSDTISFRLNDKPVRLNVDANRVLLWILRTDLGLSITNVTAFTFCGVPVPLNTTSSQADLPNCF